METSTTAKVTLVKPLATPCCPKRRTLFFRMLRSGRLSKKPNSALPEKSGTLLKKVCRNVVPHASKNKCQSRLLPACPLGS
jgi:hypothetical protein